jgi:predicted dehydrogenase
MPGESKTQGKHRRIRLGMVGGGPGAFIGGVHRIAARMDDCYELVAAALSSDPGKSLAAAEDLRIPRAYGRFEEMAAAEAGRPDGIEAVAIVTPNHMHYANAKKFLDVGIHVICDKPLTTTIEDALDLAKVVERTGLIFGLTHNYTGYPMVRQAREMVRSGELGAVRLVQVEHPEGWASTLLEASGHKQAVWRTMLDIAGKSAVVGDLGTHAHHLARFITGLEVVQVSAELSTVVPGRKADDNAHVNLRFTKGARGMMWVSMAATGNLHGQRIRVFGEKASLEWIQEQPEQLFFRPVDGPHRTLSRGCSYLSPSAQRASRIGAGHPEGFLEAFANIYTDAADAVLARRDGVAVERASPFPTVEDGVLGVKFVDAVVQSHRRDGAWVDATLDLSRLTEV